MRKGISVPLQSENDEILTNIYIARAKKEDGYYCWKPGCDFHTEHRSEFIAHFQEHINEFLMGADLFMPPKKEK